jgi:hypothetical protein
VIQAGMIDFSGAFHSKQFVAAGNNYIRVQAQWKEMTVAVNVT